MITKVDLRAMSHSTGFGLLKCGKEEEEVDVVFVSFYDHILIIKESQVFF